MTEGSKEIFFSHDVASTLFLRFEILRFTQNDIIT